MNTHSLLLLLLLSVCLLGIAQSVIHSYAYEGTIFLFTVLALCEGFIFGFVIAKLMKRGR